MGKRSSRKDSALILTCEHGGNRVPHSYRHLFNGSAELLESHRAYDAGAAELTRYLARRFGAMFFIASVSRLLVDLNRSRGNRNLFSRFSRALAAAEQERILDRYYRPHRTAVESAVADSVFRNRSVVHVAVHSFTPVLDGVERTCDVALLYDPGRPREVAFCNGWVGLLKEAIPDLRVRRNYPYRGIADGLTAYLRTRFSDRSYAGIELEINQRLLRAGRQQWSATKHLLATTLRQITRA